MYGDEKMQEKAAYEANQCAQSGAVGNGSTMCLDKDANMAGRPSLRDQVERQKYEAVRASHKAERMKELAYLLDKHPDVARILDLLEDVRR